MNTLITIVCRDNRRGTGRELPRFEKPLHWAKLGEIRLDSVGAPRVYLAGREFGSLALSGATWVRREAHHLWEIGRHSDTNVYEVWLGDQKASIEEREPKHRNKTLNFPPEVAAAMEAVFTGRAANADAYRKAEFERFLVKETECFDDALDAIREAKTMKLIGEIGRVELLLARAARYHKKALMWRKARRAHAA